MCLTIISVLALVVIGSMSHPSTNVSAIADQLPSLQGCWQLKNAPDDNLNILRRYIKDETVDLVYLDPPFNSNRNYNVLFKDESGLEADSLEWLSVDTWHWKGAASTYDDLIMTGDKVSEMPQAFRSFIGENQMMAYLVMMAVRLNLNSIRAAAGLRRFMFYFFAKAIEVIYIQSRCKVVIWNRSG